MNSGAEASLRSRTAALPARLCINVSRVCTTCKRGLAPLVPSMLAIVGIDLPPQPSRTHRFHRCRSSGRLSWSSGARQGCGPFYHRHNLLNEKTSSRLSKASVDFKSEPHKPIKHGKSIISRCCELYLRLRPRLTYFSDSLLAFIPGDLRLWVRTHGNTSCLLSLVVPRASWLRHTVGCKDAMVRDVSIGSRQTRKKRRARRRRAQLRDSTRAALRESARTGRIILRESASTVLRVLITIAHVSARGIGRLTGIALRESPRVGRNIWRESSRGSGNLLTTLARATVRGVAPNNSLLFVALLGSSAAIVTSLFAGKIELAVLFCLLALILWVTL